MKYSTESIDTMVTRPTIASSLMKGVWKSLFSIIGLFLEKWVLARVNKVFTQYTSKCHIKNHDAEKKILAGYLLLGRFLIWSITGGSSRMIRVRTRRLIGDK